MENSQVIKENNNKIINKGENNMNELIKIEVNENQEPIVSGRELHQVLGIKTKYKDWFPRMVEYGFTENVDYTLLIFEHPQNKQPTIDHVLKLDMAKEIAMIQRNEKGKTIRKYFIEVEKEYNSPEKIMARALMFAKREIASLTTINQEQENLIQEMQPKVDYYSTILNSNSLMTITQIAKDYGYSGKEFNKILHNFKIQYKQGKNWFLYSKYDDKGYTHSKTHTYGYDEDGNAKISINTQWTQKGRLFLYEFLKECGILPLIERNENK